MYMSLWQRISTLSFSLLLTLFPLSQAFYVPGWSIKSYADGDRIPLFFNKLYSDKSTLQYAFAELPFFCPASGEKLPGTNLVSGSSVPLNLGEVLRGDRITVSEYHLSMNQDEEVRFLCSHVLNQYSVEWAREVISQGYVAEWIVDNLPGATKFKTVDRTREYYAAGFKIGYEEVGSGMEDQRKYFINNHHTLVIRWNKAPGAQGRQGRKVIVGFEVYPKSVGIEKRDAHGLPTDISHTDGGYELTLQHNATDVATIAVPFTYSVYFREDESVEWANRWDLYFVNQEHSSRVHWLAILNSIVIAGLLATTVAVILSKTIRGLSNDRDEILMENSKFRSAEKGNLLDPISSDSNQPQASSLEEEDIPDDVGRLKLVHADVFRPPPNGDILAPLLGSGIQLAFVALGLLVLSCFGFLNPSFRGGFMSFAVGLFVFAGLLSGYFSARIFKTFGGQNWKRNSIITSSLVPGLLFITMFVLNLLAWAQSSSTALPFTTLLALVALLLLVQLPLVFFGGRYGYQIHGHFENPLKASAIPRQIPAHPWRSSYSLITFLPGFAHFCAIFIELAFVFQSLLQDKTSFYYQFGFMAVVSSVLVLTVVETSIIATHTQLCLEDYRWWWQSFLVGSSSAGWIFLYCLYYYFFKLHISGFISALLFFSYSFLACVVYGILMGTIGFLTAYSFVRKVYGLIKID